MYAKSPVLTRSMILNDTSFKTFCMSPSQFCEKWIPILYNISPDQRGYKAACIRELQAVTGLTERTVKSWGADMADYPDSVGNTLKFANMAYGIKHAIGIRPNQEI